RSPSSTLLPYTTLFRSCGKYFNKRGLRLPFCRRQRGGRFRSKRLRLELQQGRFKRCDIFRILGMYQRTQQTGERFITTDGGNGLDRKSTRLNSSHVSIS